MTDVASCPGASIAGVDVFRTEAGLAGASTVEQLYAVLSVRLLGRHPAARGAEVTCGCCGRERPRTGAHELGDTPGVYVCWRCSVWMAARIGRGRERMS
jgi:hypothetical protein